MTLFQARFIQYLTLIGCSIRATAGNFYARYKYVYEGEVVTYVQHRGEYHGYGGNQIDGILLREEAIAVLTAHKILPHFDTMGHSYYGGNIKYSYRKLRKKMKEWKK